MGYITLHNLKEPSYTMRESLRELKTNIQFCGDDVKVILITSTIPDEGKSTVSMNLARSLTESNKKVLYIDADMRNSVLAARLRAEENSGNEIYGLSHFLSGQHPLREIMYGTNLENLFIIFAGPVVPNPTEILEKPYFENLLKNAREHFDYIIIDCPPLGAAIDAASVARLCDGAILVIAQGMAGSRAISHCISQLDNSGVRILGAVLNKVKMKKGSYGYGYGYGNGYGYGYGNKN